ncbi:MAG: sulfite exporter TauE/SafE family protein [Ruminococcaceae bacterium]|nr:sulfite exporter TauE/SafE family protein [Oscillospiraceae bacterium]
MLTSLPVSIVIGVLLGFLAGMGVGGGSLLILWLTLIVGISHPEARWINLVFFITAAGSVSVFRWKKGTVQIRKLLPAIIAGSISAALFAWLRGYLQPQLLQKGFGLLLLFTGIRELLYRPRKAK